MNLSDFLQKVHWIDFVLLVIFIRTVYIGAKRGFMPELTTLIGLVIAVVVSLQHAHEFSVLLSGWLHLSEEWLKSLSVVLLFSTTYFVFRLVRAGISKLFRLQTVQGFNQWGGVLVGLLRATVLSSLVLLILWQAPSLKMKEGIKEKSLTAPYLIEVVPKMYEICLQVYPFRSETGETSLAIDF